MDEHVDPVDGGEESVDLRLVADVAGQGSAVAAELGGEGFRRGEVHVDEEQWSPGGQLAGDGGPHAGSGTDHDVGHFGLPPRRLDVKVIAHTI